MPQMIFVNLPVRDLAASRSFYTALGFSFNPLFSNDTSACLVISDTIFAMLLTHKRFADFCALPIADPQTSVAHLLALSRESRAEVDLLATRALAAGGREPNPAQDHGFMYARSVTDPDGHIWEAFWMDPAAATAGPPTE